MAKKRRKKSVKGRGLGSFFAFLGGTVRVLLRVMPFIIITSIAVASFLGVRQALYADTSLAIDKIVVQPSDSLPLVERQTLETRLLGKNILKADLAKISHDLEKNPLIQSAKVVRHLPSQISVGIELRKPLALIQFSQKGGYGLVSEDGMVLDVLAKPDPSYLVIEALNSGSKNPELGAIVKVKGFREAAQLIQVYAEHTLRTVEPLTKLSLDHLGNVTVVFSAGPPIRMGRRPADRIKALEKIMPMLEGDGRDKIEYVDLQFDNVILKRKG